jgi:hypothetical protein
MAKNRAKQKTQKTSSSSRQKAQRQLKSFMKKGPGTKVSRSEVKKVVGTREAPKAAPKKVLRAAKKNKNIKLSGSARKYVRSLLPRKEKIQEIIEENPRGVFQDDGLGHTEPIFQHEKDIENIRADADRYIADAEVRGIDISSGRQLEGAKYVADKESEWRQAVANIEVKGRLDLQPIINAGLEKVANIEAAAQRDVADITGRYDVEGIRVRGEADKQIGGMQLAGNMYNLINAAFG